MTWSDLTGVGKYTCAGTYTHMDNLVQNLQPTLLADILSCSTVCGLPSRGGGFFHSKGTWGCAAREGILFRTSSLAKGVLYGNFSRVRSRQGYAFWEFWSKRCQNSVIFVKKTQLLKNFGLENAKIWQVLPRKCQFRALLKEKLV